MNFEIEDSEIIFSGKVFEVKLDKIRYKKSGNTAVREVVLHRGGAVIIAVIMLFVRLLASLVFVRRYGIRNAMLLAFSHAMPLTLLVAVATLAFHAESITAFQYEALVLASLVEVIVAMAAIKWINRRHRPDSEWSGQSLPERGSHRQ